jgi:Zn-dependent peptidase ImmA (M78 family)
MISSSDKFKEADAAFDAFRERYGIAVPRDVAEELSRTIVLLSLARSHHQFRLEEIFPKRLFKPRASLAVEMAHKIRLLSEIGEEEPLFDLSNLLLEKFGIPVFQMSKLGHVSSGCARLAAKSCIFVADDNEIDALFNCSHQLAHVLLFHLYGREGVSLDVLSCGLGVPKPPYEHFADVFALELLMPPRGLGIALKQIRVLLGAKFDGIGEVELLYLSRIFGVSFLAAAKRCERAKLLPPGGAIALERFMIDKFGGPEQRSLSLDLPPRVPTTITALPKLGDLQIKTRSRISKLPGLRRSNDQSKRI